MTDKELAEQYAIENYEHYEEGQTDYKALKQAFLVGLEARKPKWHKVADGDLPSVNSIVLDEDGDKITYTGNNIWKVYSEIYEGYIEIEPPVAWCEVPIYIDGELMRNSAKAREEHITKLEKENVALKAQ